MSSSIPSTDQDLYDDLYGADETELDFEDNPDTQFESAVSPQDHTNASSSLNKDESVPKSPVLSKTSSNVINKTTQSASSTSSKSNSATVVGAKNRSDSSSATSYSAQIAKQFSAYQQTPSQERQQRASMSLGPTSPISPSVATASAISSYESRTENDKPFIPHDRPIRPSEMKDEGKMFIGGLSWDTTDEGLRNYFNQFGRVEASTILRDPEGRSRGFAFLTFEDPSSVNVVLAKEHFLDGKSIDPKRAIPRSAHMRAQRFFVGGLAPTTTGESLRAFFEPQGKIVDANVMGDRESGRNKGFGFITFEDLSDLQLDKIVNGSWEVDGKTIEIKLAQPRSQRQQTSSGPAAIGTYTSDMRSHSNTPTPATMAVAAAGSGASLGPQDMNALYSRLMGQMGQVNPMMNSMMAGGMGMMGMGGMTGGGMMTGAGMNPMMNNGMGVNMNMNPMMNGMMGMGGMPMGRFTNPGMQFNGMGDGSGVVGVGGNASAMRMGFGPMGNAGQMGMGMGMGMGMSPMGVMNPAMRGRGGMNGVGPARVMNRGNNSFHPYSR